MRKFLLALTAVFLLGSPVMAAGDGPLKWREFSDEVFEQAGCEDRYVLLHMAAVWCHWCHVMENTTYRDPAVLNLIDDKLDLYLRLEWWDRKEGKLPNNEIEYPELDRAAVFACSGNFCSLPAFEASEIADRIAAVSRRP